MANRRNQLSKLLGCLSIPLTGFLADRNYRLVIMREKTGDPQLELYKGEKFNYRCILTNDHLSTEKEVIIYYNLRGSSEKIFDIQNNDFGWNRLPTFSMNANTTYLILTAMLKNFYNYPVGKVSQVFTDIQPASRLKGKPADIIPRRRVYGGRSALAYCL